MNKPETAIPAVPKVDLPYGLKLEDYWHFMDDWAITNEQKTAWVIELAHIVKGFVDWGIGQDTAQMLLAQNFVDKCLPESTGITPDSENLLEQKNTKNSNLART